jgi:hypothetical protein
VQTVRSNTPYKRELAQKPACSYAEGITDLLGHFILGPFAFVGPSANRSSLLRSSKQGMVPNFLTWLYAVYPTDRPLENVYQLEDVRKILKLHAFTMLLTALIAVTILTMADCR